MQLVPLRARDQRAALEPILSDLQHMALAHGHAATLRPDLDSYDVAIETPADGTPCRCAARDQRATLEPALRNVLHVALAHGHRVTLTPGLDSYDIAIQIDPDRPCDSDDRIVHSRATPIRPPATVSQSGPSRSAW